MNEIEEISIRDNNGIHIGIRGFDPKDKAFIMATWLRGVYYDITESLRPDAKQYFKLEGYAIENTLRDPDVTIRVASDTVDPLWIAGYSVSLGSDLHWIYVRKDFRKQGLAKLLLDGLNITHVRNLTKIGADISERKGLVFKPFT